MAMAIDTDAEPVRQQVDLSAPLGTFISLLPERSPLVVEAEEQVSSVCRLLHERGLWNCLVRLPDGSYRFFELVDLCKRLLDALQTDTLFARVVKVLGACSVGDLTSKEEVPPSAPSSSPNKRRRQRKEPVRPLPASTALADVLEGFLADGRVVVAGEDGAVRRIFTCSDLLELLLRYARGSVAALLAPAKEALAALEGEHLEKAAPETPVMSCFQALLAKGLDGLAVLDDTDARQPLLERALGTLAVVDVQYFFLRPAEEAAALAAKSAREFVALGLRELPVPRAGAGAAHYPFIHADVGQSLEVLVSKLLSSKAYCIATCSTAENRVLGMVRPRGIMKGLWGSLAGATFALGGAPPSPSCSFWPSPAAASAAAGPLLPEPEQSERARRVSWRDGTGSASLASVVEFEPETPTPRQTGSSMVLALEDGHEGAGDGEVVRLPRHSGQLPQQPPAQPPPPSASPKASSSGSEQFPHHQHILSVLAQEEPSQESLEPCDAGSWRQLSPGPEEQAEHHGNHRHSDHMEQLQLVLYQKRELVLYDRSRNRAYARRLTEEQAQMITTGQQSFCPLCRQRLNPSWAFVVEGYFEMISSMAVPSAPSAGSTFGSDEEAAAACGLHSIPMGVLNQGYYQRFFFEDRKLGSGSFGAVYLCRHVMDEIELGVFAVKKLALGDDTKRLRQVMREVKALERLRHMNIIDYKHSWLEVSRHSEFCPYVPFLFILMEYCNAGSLEDLVWPGGFVRGAVDNVARSTVLAEELIWVLFLDICRGLRHLHGRGILHRDLKPSNILLHMDDVPGDTSSSGSCSQGAVPRAILSDFGTCEILGELGENVVGGGHVHGGYAVEFSAPERLSGEESDEPADMWSAGLVLYAMAYGDLPFHSEDPMLCREKVMAHTVLPELPDWRDATLRGLISALTAREPVARPTAAEVERVAFAACARQQRQKSKGSNETHSLMPPPGAMPPPGGMPLTLLDMDPASSPVNNDRALLPMIPQNQSGSSLCSDVG